MCASGEQLAQTTEQEAWVSKQAWYASADTGATELSRL